jgi:hypothetical protein
MYHIKAAEQKISHVEQFIHLLSLNADLRDGHEYWLGVGARPPVVGGDGRDVGQRVRVQVFLEELRLSWHNKRNHLAEAIVVQPIKSSDFAGGNVHASLAHHTDASLGIRCLEGVDVVHERRLGRDLEVANHAVTLQSKSDYSEQSSAHTTVSYS